MTPLSNGRIAVLSITRFMEKSSAPFLNEDSVRGVSNFRDLIILFTVAKEVPVYYEIVFSSMKIFSAVCSYPPNPIYPVIPPPKK